MAVPFDMYGVEFILTTGTPGVPVVITFTKPGSDDALLQQGSANSLVVIPREETTSVRLQLTPGIANIQATSGQEIVAIQVAVEDWVTWISVFGEQAHIGTVSRLQEREDAVLSPTGSLLTERWFKDADLLPRANGLHRLAMRQLNDGLSRAGVQNAVERVTAAITGNNAVLHHVRNNSLMFDFTQPVYDVDEDFSGVEFHVWTQDVCLTAFLTAGRYVENFRRMFTPVRYGESSVAYKDTESQTGHVFVNAGSNGPGCTIDQAIMQQGCFDRYRPWVKFRQRKSFVICMASYTLDTGVEVCNALGTVYTDCENLTLEETITDPDVVDVEDPTGDGWVGFQLDGGLDYPYGGGMDTWGSVDDMLAEQCPYERGPVATPLFTTRTDTTVEIELSAFGTLTLTGAIATPGRGGILTPV